MMRALVVPILGLVALGCGGGARTAPAPSSAPAPRQIETASQPASGASALGALVGAPTSQAAGTRRAAGSLSKSEIARVMRRNQARVRYCYERVLIKLPSLAGTVVVKFMIMPSGQVGSATVASSSLGNARAEQCIVDAVLKFAFPPPPGGGKVIVRYPYKLQTTDRRDP